MTDKIRTLTGITTTGTPHLGNYVGAIRPAIEASRRDDVESFYFLADYHALIKCEDPARIAQSRLEIAATWLALGLDTDRAFFYRQSDIPEIPELTWLLTCVTAKGLLNRAHAYKAAVDRNVADNEDGDAGVTAGLFMYPVLMAADILIFNAHRVPVGRDQVQHIEMARDIGQRFNHLYGGAFRAVTGSKDDPFVLPEAVTDDNVATLPGLDGRKMSKSYNNTIPLWLPAKQMKKAILGIVTDSRAPGEAKDPEGSNVFALYQAFATEDETWSMREAFADGIGWGDAKQKLFERIDCELAESRERYNDLMARPHDIETILRDGARKARERSVPLLRALREAVGLGSEQPFGARVPKGEISSPKALPQWKRYVESGLHFAKLVDSEGNLLFQSKGLADARQASAIVDVVMSYASRPNFDGIAPEHVEFSGDTERIAEAVRLIAAAKEEKKRRNTQS
ncbi:tryptophan--tRNA ligase [Dokdonella immobilis]|uniref:Tryptophan--tRNA ligase n=1 Tax=Dokdonella immobilis TaxID=578942 RepID=A0A1I4VI53_9GAMM|nr:tryptophanyl-tRNA synthetase [Dokdonella immobilis]